MSFARHQKLDEGYQWDIDDVYTDLLGYAGFLIAILPLTYKKLHLESVQVLRAKIERLGTLTQWLQMMRAESDG